MPARASLASPPARPGSSRSRSGCSTASASPARLARLASPPVISRWRYLFFNVGVEIGQLLFVAVVLALLRFSVSDDGPCRIGRLSLPPYLIGSFAMFWVIQRVSVF